MCDHWGKVNKNWFAKERKIYWEKRGKGWYLGVLVRAGGQKGVHN